jgi:hypothetical protein
MKKSLKSPTEADRTHRPSPHVNTIFIPFYYHPFSCTLAVYKPPIIGSYYHEAFIELFLALIFVSSGVFVSPKEALTFRVEPSLRLFSMPDYNDNNGGTNESNVQDSGHNENVHIVSTRHVFKIVQPIAWPTCIGESTCLGTDKGKEQGNKTANAI